MAQTPYRRDVLGLTLCMAALLACGPKTWSSRPASLPTRTLSVDERQLFAQGTQPGCASTLVVRVAPSCESRCKSVALDRDGQRFATLLGPTTAEVAPLPSAAKPAYVTPGRDESRVGTAVPIPSAGASIALASACGARLRTTDARLVLENDTVVIGAEAARACESLHAEVVCP